MDVTAVIVAGIAAVAAIVGSVMTYLAARAQKKTDRKVSTSNGHTLGQLVEELSHALMTHINNWEIHQAESHAHALGYCAQCGSSR